MRVLVHICCGPCSITVLQRLQDAGHEPVGLFFNPNIHPLAEYLRRREGAIQAAEKLTVPLILADTLPEAEQSWAAPGSTEIISPQTEDSALFPGRNLANSGSGPGVPATALHAFAPSGSGTGDPFHTALPDLPPAVDPIPWLRAVSGREDRRCLFCWSMRLRKTAQLAAARGFEAITTSLLYSRYQDHERIRRMGEALAASRSLSFIYQDFRTSWQDGIRISKEWGIYRQQYCGCMFSEYDRYARDCRRAVRDEIENMKGAQ